MDGSTVEYSDSDSGESWTLLENIPTYGDDAPDFPETTAIITSERENVEVQSEKDEDTDGISIISDSDPESTPCKVSYEKCLPEVVHPADQENTPLLSSILPSNNNHNIDSVKDETDFLGDKIKCKTYVHKRNPKVGTILDIIMLGTFIITAGMALGHLWSCKNECTTQTSVNKILSNLYKLQEENAYLRNKLKEVTAAVGYQNLEQRKSINDKMPVKQYRCKKIFEEPVIKNKNGENFVKCVTESKSEYDPLAMPEHDTEFLNDINKMKDIYNHNKIWLDEEIKKKYESIVKMNNDDATSKSNNAVKSKQINWEKKLGPAHKLPSSTEKSAILQDAETISSNILELHKQINVERQLGPIYEVPVNMEQLQHDIKEGTNTEANILESHRQINLELQIGGLENQYTSSPYSEVQSEPTEIHPEKKITYADSLKIGQPLQKSQRSENDDTLNRRIKDHLVKHKHKDDVLLNLESFSDDNIKKDDRYTGPKIKHEKKKHDRPKSHKKQKRNNKYQQWEMKGGYLKDYDEFSVTSSQDNDVLVNNPDKKFLNPDFENYINKFAETENNISNNIDQPKITKNFDDKFKVKKGSLKNEKGKKNKNKDSEWYDKRSALRAEARMKLEQELFAENTSNNAAWYFRRMQKREQCRAQRDNSTFKKFSKRKMNFKMKR